MHATEEVMTQNKERKRYGSKIQLIAIMILIVESARIIKRTKRNSSMYLGLCLL